MRHFLSAFLLLLCCPLAGAESTVHWLQVKTDHFTVLTDNNERQARHIAGQLERMHAVFAKLLPAAKDDPGAHIVVLAFRDRKGFQSVEPAAYLGKDALNLAGLFMSRQDRSYILLRMDTDGDHPYATVYHEYTHYMVRHSKDLPIWLNEGLAQFYQNTDILDKRVNLGQPSANDILFLRQQKLLPLSTLFLVDHNSPYYHEEDKGNIFYAESWALTHFLSLQDFGAKQNRLRDYMGYIEHGEGPVVAAQHAFGDLKVLQGQLEGYIRNGDYRALSMPLQNAVDEKDLAVEPLPTPDADAMRADVLAENGRAKDAEALITSVLAQTPESAQAHESMGTIKLRQGDMEAARKWYGEAVALHSTSFLAYYYFGTLSMRDGSAGQEAAGDTLRKAIELNPHFAPALDALARLDGMRHEHLDEAVQMAVRAVSQDPSNIDYRLNAAEIRVARKELPSAVTILEAAEKLAQTPEDRDRVQTRLIQVQQYQAAVQRVEALETSSSVGAKSEKLGSASTASMGSRSEVRDLKGNVLHPIRLITPDHSFPATAGGPKHTVIGTLRHVGCFDPKGLLLEVGGSTKPVTLYSNDMYSISFTAANFDPKGELNPCNEFEGMKAKVSYADVDDPTVSGQILAMELSR